MPAHHRKHRGTVLVIALVLLLIVTLLATTGMAMSTAEFVMAGNEQFHRKAMDAASAGVETVIARLPAQRASMVVIALDHTEARAQRLADSLIDELVARLSAPGGARTGEGCLGGPRRRHRTRRGPADGLAP